MSVESHLQALADKRSAIKAQIATEMQRPQPDLKLIYDWKKANLKLKEEMQACFERMRQDSEVAS